MTDWSFRYRLALGEGMRLNCVDPELYLTDPDAPEPVSLHSWKGGPISETSDLTLRGSGYESAESAERHAVQWRSWVTVAFAAHNLGADFGQRVPPFWISPEYRAANATDEHTVVLEDRHELIIFETTPRPRFLHIAVGDVTFGKSATRVRQAIQVAIDRGVELSLDAPKRIAAGSC